MTPLAGVHVLGRGHISYKMQMHYFFKNRLLYSEHQFRQTKYKVMMTKEGYTLIIDSMPPGLGVLCQGVAI